KFLRHDRGGGLAPHQGRGRGRPADQWVVADIEGLRGYLESISPRALQTTNLALDPDDETAIAVNVAEDALAQVPGENDPELRQLLFESARSSLLFAKVPDSGNTTECWWQERDDSYAA